MRNREIERKFLVSKVPESDLVNGLEFRQGYIITSSKILVKVSVSDGQGCFKIESGKLDKGGQFFSYNIPKEQAHLLIAQLAEVTDMNDSLLKSSDSTSIRVRVAYDKAYVTIKGPRVGISCLEIEFPIPLIDGVSILDTIADAKQVHKIRYTKLYNGFNFKLDVFEMDNKGLIVAEVDLEDETVEIAAFPEGWVMEEVTDKKYSNNSLALHPYSKWEDKPHCLIVK